MRPQWTESEPSGIRILTWNPKEGVSYNVIQYEDIFTTTITTGTAYKFTKTIGQDWATELEAKWFCELNFASDFKPNTTT